MQTSDLPINVASELVTFGLPRPTIQIFFIVVSSFSSLQMSFSHTENPYIK
jgi:hypothetical protein